MAFHTSIMFFLLLIACTSVVFTAEAEVKVEVQEELQPEESVHTNHEAHSFADGLELMRHRDQRLYEERDRILGSHEQRYHEDPRHPAADGLDKDDLPGPVILRTPDPLPHHGHPDIEAQNRIIADVFSPDYYQPTWVLDYRYLKTGGRDYTRGPGGQILILPKGVRSKEHKEFPDYDAYIEHLRLSRIAEEQHYGHDDDRHRGWNNAQSHRRGHHGHDRHEGHGQTMWRKF